MRIILTDMSGRSPEQAVEAKLQEILQRLQRTGKTIQDGLLWTVRNHFREIYPGSRHYDPEKVQPKDESNGQTPQGTVEIDVPGVTRAYRDLLIKPKLRKSLTIPMHRSSYGKRAADFPDAFVVKNRDGKRFIAENRGGDLVFLFYLAKSAFQKRD